jgi:hypothetical protein
MPSPIVGCLTMAASDIEPSTEGFGTLHETVVSAYHQFLYGFQSSPAASSAGVSWTPILQVTIRKGEVDFATV